MKFRNNAIRSVAFGLIAGLFALPASAAPSENSNILGTATFDCFLSYDSPDSPDANVQESYSLELPIEHCVIDDPFDPFEFTKIGSCTANGRYMIDNQNIVAEARLSGKVELEAEGEVAIESFSAGVEVFRVGGLDPEHTFNGNAQVNGVKVQSGSEFLIRFVAQETVEDGTSFPLNASHQCRVTLDLSGSEAQELDTTPSMEVNESLAQQPAIAAAQGRTKP